MIFSQAALDCDIELQVYGSGMSGPILFEEFISQVLKVDGQQLLVYQSSPFSQQTNGCRIVLHNKIYFLCCKQLALGALRSDSGRRGGGIGRTMVGSGRGLLVHYSRDQGCKFPGAALKPMDFINL